MPQGTRLFRRLALAAVLATVGGGLGMQAAHASGPPASVLGASPTSLTLDVGGNGGYLTSGTITVSLDPSTCLSALNNGLAYTITVTDSDTTGVTSVLPAQSDKLQCPNSNGKKGYATSATFTVTTVCPANPPTFPITPTLNFQPVVGPQGIQDKLGGIPSYPVTVYDNGATCTGGGGTQCVGICPNNGGNPAAPAVTNAYLDAGAAAGCQLLPAFSGKNWRGTLVSWIANTWMPKPESVKDDPTVFPNADSWMDYVTTEVDTVCNLGYSNEPGGVAYPTPAGLPSDTTPFPS